MTWRSAEQIADALLYEGYLLYPYRGTAVKNRYRWQFGIVAPRDYGAAGGSEPWLMQAQCLIEPGAAPVLDLKVRFLQVEARQVEAPGPAPGAWTPVDSLYVDGRELVTWDEAVPRDIVLRHMPVGDQGATRAEPFEIAGGREVEEIRDVAGDVAARVTRERWPISGTVHLEVRPVGDLRKVSLRLENLTPWQGSDGDRPDALRRSLIAAHTLLAVRDGAFVSLLDPPERAQAAVAACENLHTWPVLVGDPPGRDLMLSSPIILYDYPRVAPESPGDLFDGTEIDELLTLRLMTLTDEERRQALATDPRAGQVIDRATSLPTEQLERLHGAIRYLGAPMPDAARAATPADLEAWLNPPGSEDEEAVDGAGRRVGKGSRVRLRPAGRADAQDMFLSQQTATVAAVYRDLEDRAHVAVMVDAGGAADLHESNGRFYYFRPDEVEVLEDGAAEEPAAAVGTARVLVAGIGNVFLGDDGFGSAVAERLGRRSLPAWVRVEDFGIRSVHLAYDLLDAGYETTILIDALPRGGEPGTLYVVEPDVREATPVAAPDGHSGSVESVLAFLEGLGGKAGRVLIVGCEPQSLAPEMGLSDAVAAAVEGAADLVVNLIHGRAG